MEAIISVLIPVYNTERFLARCVDSILCQSFRAFDLLLLDDGSTDGSPEICDAYAKKDSRIHVIHQENRGVAFARNAAIEWALENSRSQWLTFVDSDDYIHTEYLKTLYQACIEGGVDFCACGWVEVSEDTPIASEPLSDVQNCVCAPEQAFIRNEIGYGPCNKLARKALYESVRFPEGWRFAEDSATTYKVPFACSQIAVVPQAIYYYQKNENSLTHSRWNTYKMARLISSEQQLAYFANGYPLAYRKCLEDSVTVISTFLHWRRRDAEEDKESLRTLKKHLRKYIRELSRRYSFDKWKWYRYHMNLQDCDLWEKLHIYWYVFQQKIGRKPVDAP